MTARKTCRDCGRQAYADRWDDVCLACKAKDKR